METSRSVPFPGRIGRYELLVPIGAGGMATVYLARVLVVDTIHRPVAIKLMHPELRRETRAAQELIEEAKLVGSIRHPNVVQVLDAGDTGGYVYLVFDYVDGETLAGFLTALRKERRTLPLPIAAKIACDVLGGLQAAHELTDIAGKPARLIHRDVSPQNILVGVDGLSRIIDFGIAKAVSRLSVTATGIVKGKVGYMSPEQARGGAIDQRTDVWASGVVIWELLSGRRLFREKNDVATLAKIVEDEPVPRVRRFRPDVPPEVDALVARALAKDSSERFESAAAMRGAMTRAFASSIQIAEADEVGEFVARLVEPALADRRSKAAQVIELHGKVDALGLSAALDVGTSSELTKTADMAPSVLEPTRDETLPGKRVERPNRKTLILAAAIALVLVPVGAWAWAKRSSGVSVTSMSSSADVFSARDPAASRSVTPPVDTTEALPSASTAMSADVPSARIRKSVRPRAKRPRETVSGAEQIKLEPPPYGR